MLYFLVEFNLYFVDANITASSINAASVADTDTLLLPFSSLGSTSSTSSSACESSSASTSGSVSTSNSTPDCPPPPSSVPLISPVLQPSGLTTPSPHSVPSTTSAKEVFDFQSELQDLFPSIPDTLVHHYSKCCQSNCYSLSNSEIERIKAKGSKDKFAHNWINDKSLAWCTKSNLAWLIYVGERGMFCFLCMKYGTCNRQNKSSTFNETPSVRFKKSTIREHANSQQHKDAIEARFQSGRSVFHKQLLQKDKSNEEVLFKVFSSAYWMAKEEISNRKFSSLVTLLKQLKLPNMEYFTYTGNETVRDIFIVLGNAVEKRVLSQLCNAGTYGLLSDEVTDIAVMEMLITFVQFFNQETDKVQTNFLSVNNILAQSDSANAETIYKILVDMLTSLNIPTEKLSSFASDGCSVMTGKKSGVAQRLKVGLNKSILSFHCICHRLALACTDANVEVKYIADMELWLRQLWKLFENSPKRTAALYEVQVNLSKLPSVSKKARTAVTRKLKKACKTRWLSFDAAVDAMFSEYVAVLQTLNNIANDPVAYGLLQKVKTVKFLGAIYILHEVLPILATLSKVFQKGSVNFSSIDPAIKYSLAKLTKIQVTNSPISRLKVDLSSAGRLRFVAEEISFTQSKEQELKNLTAKYIMALTENIKIRFNNSLPVVSAFAIFDPLATPMANEDGFDEYGKDEIETMANHFYNNKDKAESEAALDRASEESDDLSDDDPNVTNLNKQLSAEWEKFKYDLNFWKKSIPKQVKKSKKMTVTEWCLTRLVKLKTSYGAVYPLLTNIAEICLAMPVSNAWPERGASAVKRIKTRLRSRMKVDLMQAALQISINGPDMGSEEQRDVIESAIQQWKEAKKRRKLPKCILPKNVVEAEKQAAVVEQVDASVQTQGMEVDIDTDDPCMTVDENEVDLLSRALNLTDSDCDSISELQEWESDVMSLS